MTRSSAEDRRTRGHREGRSMTESLRVMQHHNYTSTSRRSFALWTTRTRFRIAKMHKVPMDGIEITRKDNRGALWHLTLNMCRNFVHLWPMDIQECRDRLRQERSQLQNGQRRSKMCGHHIQALGKSWDSKSATQHATVDCKTVVHCLGLERSTRSLHKLRSGEQVFAATHTALKLTYV